jgi:endonuclease YncB( thermonuclease family)
MLEFSNEALELAKSYLIQRDVILDVDSADKRGTFFGTLQLTTKEDFGLILIQEGLAQVNVMGNKIPYNIDDLEEAEEEAKQSGRGIWSKSMKLMSQHSPKKIK